MVQGSSYVSTVPSYGRTAEAGASSNSINVLRQDWRQPHHIRVPAVSSTAPHVFAGRKWKPKDAVLQTQAAHRDVDGQEQHERSGCGLN